MDKRLFTIKLTGVRFVHMGNAKHIPVWTNGGVVLLAVLAHIYQLFALPCLLELEPWTLLFVPFSLLMVVTNAVLVHEAIHNLLLPNRWGNELLGRFLAILEGVCLDLQKWDHLQHHVHNSTHKNCPDVRVTTEGIAPRYDYAKYVYTGLVGLFLSEFFFNISTCFRSRRSVEKARVETSLGGPGPSSSQIAMCQLLTRGRLKHVRLDGALILATNTLSLYCFRNHLILFVALFLTRAFLLTFLDSFAHFKTPVNAKWFAKNVAVTKPLERLVFLNFNLHGVHHVFPDRSWITLPLLRESNPLQLTFPYHQNLFQALRDKLARPKYVSSFPEVFIEFQDVGRET